MEAIFPIDIDMDHDTSMPDISDLSLQAPPSPHPQPQQNMFCRPLASPLTLPSPVQPYGRVQNEESIEITPTPSPKGLPIPLPEPPKTPSLFHQRHHTPSLMNTGPLLYPGPHYHPSIRFTTIPTTNGHQLPTFHHISPIRSSPRTPQTPKPTTHSPLRSPDNSRNLRTPTQPRIPQTSRFAPSLSGHLTPYPSPLPDIVTRHLTASPSRKDRGSPSGGKKNLPLRTEVMSEGDETSWGERRAVVPVVFIPSSDRQDDGRSKTAFEGGGKGFGKAGVRSALGELGQQRVYARGGRGRGLGSPFDDGGDGEGNEGWEGDDESEEDGERERRGTRVWFAGCNGGRMGKKATRVRGNGVYV